MAETNSSAVQVLAVDSHVHLYDWVNLVPMLDNALASFSSAVQQVKGEAAFSGVLVLTEPRQRDTFSRLHKLAAEEQPCSLSRDWDLELTQETLSLRAKHQSGVAIYLISGQQVVTREGLEVLAVGTAQTLPDRMSLEETLKGVRERDGYPILPWGVGKWLFSRGTSVNKAIEENGGKPLAIGDNGGRPTFWAKVGQFGKAKIHDIPIVNGTDPLPASTTKRDAGSYGTIFVSAFAQDTPANSLLKIFSDKSSERINYGSLERPVRFIMDQIALRLS